MRITQVWGKMAYSEIRLDPEGEIRVCPDETDKSEAVPYMSPCAVDNFRD